VSPSVTDCTTIGGLCESGGAQLAPPEIGALTKRAATTPAQMRRLFGDGPATKALIEAIDATTGINHFLLSSVERVTFLAHIHRKIFATR
jgi:hypothetical protein